MDSLSLSPEIQEKLDRLLSIGEECITKEELANLLVKKPNFIAYDGFEPSGRMHIAQGILKAVNVNKITESGGTFVFWVADWFAMLNKKMDGDLEKIQTVGKYMIEVWKAVGMNMDRVVFKWASQEILSRPGDYMATLLDIATKNSLARVTRCSQIMGRAETDDLTAAQIIYPCMQATDIFFLKADICQLGMDQRKVNMLAREYCDAIKRRNKPIILSHPMLMGLKEGQAKMSKSDPDSAIFMEDSEADVNLKIKKAYCPPGVVEANPVLDYLKHIIFARMGEFTVERSERDGGLIKYASYPELEADYVNGTLHPGDLKPAVAKAINQLIEPVRQHFLNDPVAKDLLKRVKSFKTTR